MLRWYLALWPYQVGRAYRLLEMVCEGSPGHGPILFLSASAAEIGFGCDPLGMGWSRPGLLLLSNLAGPAQHFKTAILGAWRNKVAADLCSGRLLDVFGSLQFLNSSHVRERDKALLRSVMVGGVWNGFLLCWVSLFLVVFVVLQKGMVTCFGNVPFLLLFRFVKILSFMISRQGALAKMLALAWLASYALWC